MGVRVEIVDNETGVAGAGELRDSRKAEIDAVNEPAEGVGLGRALVDEVVGFEIVRQ